MKQILIILTLCFAINDMMGVGLGHGLVISNCPAVEVDQDGEITCIYIVDGYIQIELKIDELYPSVIFPISNYDPFPTSSNSFHSNFKVDFSSIDGFVDHGIPYGAIQNGGYMINIPASDWTYSTFFFYVWIKDDKGHIVEHQSYKVKDLDICSGTPPLRLAKENKPILSDKNLLIESDENFKIFPNPVYKDMNIEIPILHSGTIVVELYNDKGQLTYSNSDQVIENTVYLNQINNLHIPKGVYICQITSDYGKRYTSKIVKL